MGRLRGRRRRRQRRDRAMNSNGYESDPESENSELPPPGRSGLCVPSELPLPGRSGSCSGSCSCSCSCSCSGSCPPSELPLPGRSDDDVAYKGASDLDSIFNSDSDCIFNSDTETEDTIESPNAEQRERKKRRELCTLLYKAASTGYWNAAETDLRSNYSLKITVREDMPLHIAALAKQTEFVQKLVNYMSKEDLEKKNRDKSTAFSYAAMSGVVEIAKVMYQKNEALPTIRNKWNRSPIEIAARVGDRKMVEYLYEITPLNKDFEAKELRNILCATINSEMYDITLQILEANRSIVTSYVNIASALVALARKPISYYDPSQEWICESLTRIFPYFPCFKRIYGSTEKRRQAGKLVEKLCELIPTLENSKIFKLFGKTPILDDAAKIGNVEFFTLLSRSYPDLIWRRDSKSCNIFDLAVIYRQEKVFSLIHHTGALKDIFMRYSDHYKEPIFHLAARLAPSDRLNIVSGAALQMQRELLWFKEVEKNLLPSHGQMKNKCRKTDKTPRELFTEEHEKLREAGEKWMKDTATSCMVVATLIATVAFTAAFTVPSENKEEIGAPIFLNNMRWFTVFVISDAVAMFSSTASIMMFLSILTSRYGEEDFLYKLPAKLMIGLFTLFTSLVCMDLTFTATFFLVYKEEKLGILPKVIAGLALLPITLYAMLNFRLWISLIHSTIWASRFMFRLGKHRLF